MAVMSAAGQQIFSSPLSPGFMDLSPGYTYVIAMINPTAVNIVAGVYVIQDAAAEADDPCTPDATTWADLQVEPECDALPGTVAGPATIAFSAGNPLPANSQCQYAVPCPRQFVRVNATDGTAVVVGMVGRLRRTGMQGLAA